jgi:hypothetical protein
MYDFILPTHYGVIDPVTREGYSLLSGNAFDYDFDPEYDELSD